MKKVLISIILVLLPFTSISAELAIVDIDYLIKVSKKGKNIQKDLKVKNDKVFEDFSLKEKKLKEREDNIKSKKNVLSESDYKKEVSKFTDDVKKYNINKKTIGALNKEKNQKIAELLKEINSILIEYSKKNDISTLLDKKNVIITKSENDITQKILKILDN